MESFLLYAKNSTLNRFNAFERMVWDTLKMDLC